MIRLVALDFVLGIVLARVMHVSFVVNIFRVHLYDFAADVSGLRVPGHVISDFEIPCHGDASPVTALPQRSDAFVKGAVTLIVIARASSIPANNLCRKTASTWGKIRNRERLPIVATTAFRQVAPADPLLNCGKVASVLEQSADPTDLAGSAALAPALSS
jgi:hypothetical protein